MVVTIAVPVCVVQILLYIPLLILKLLFVLVLSAPSALSWMSCLLSSILTQLVPRRCASLPTVLASAMQLVIGSVAIISKKYFLIGKCVVFPKELVPQLVAIKQLRLKINPMAILTVVLV